jgi:hypothetical protein
MLECSSACVSSNTVCEMTLIQDRQEEKILTDFPNLIPVNRYPRQILQGILALEHLVGLGDRPSQVLIRST